MCLLSRVHEDVFEFHKNLVDKTLSDLNTAQGKAGGP